MLLILSSCKSLNISVGQPGVEDESYLDELYYEYDYEYYEEDDFDRG
jgi:hypothetical protein